MNVKEKEGKIRRKRRKKRVLVSGLFICWPAFVFQVKGLFFFFFFSSTFPIRSMLFFMRRKSAVTIITIKH